MKEEIDLFNYLTGYNCTKKDYYPIVKEFLYDRDFILSFDIEWSNISWSQKLSENFIREFKDKIDWVWISKYQTLSEPFIREFKDRVDWNRISFNPNLNLSPEFKKEFGII